MPRKSTYSARVGKAICKLIAEGQSLRKACEAVQGAKPSTVIGWTLQNKTFAEQYAQARQVGWHVQADQLLDVAKDRSRDNPLPDGRDGYRADTTAVQRDRLIVDSLKWVLSKMLPKEYGDKTTEGGTGPRELPPLTFRVTDGPTRE